MRPDVKIATLSGKGRGRKKGEVEVACHSVAKGDWDRIGPTKNYLYSWLCVQDTG